MPKYTTRQVARRLGLTTQRLHAILVNYPGLRPVERDSTAKNLLWSEPELAALQDHIESHPFVRKSLRSSKAKAALNQTEPSGFTE